MSGRHQELNGADSEPLWVGPYAAGFKYGKPITVTDQSRPKLTLKLLSKVSVDKRTGCWNWVGAKGKNGYGRLLVGEGVVRFTHRISYALFIGPLPEGLELDHLCRNHGCINPEHLEAVSRRENLLRGNTFAARHARKTHCPRGHEYTVENTSFDSKHRRDCRSCRRKVAAA